MAIKTVMAAYFPYGLLRVGDIRDEIDLNTGLAISNVQRLAYSDENLATAQASGREWEADTDYIYLERATATTNEIELDGQYDVSDHGLEYFTGTDVSVYAIIIYGNNLKNKLERDVVTKSADIVNGFDSTATDKALSANAGKVLNDHIAKVESITGTVTDVKTLTNSGTNYEYTVSETGWYSVSVVSGNTSGASFCRITIGNTIIMQIAVSLGQYDRVLPSPVYLKAGTTIKGMAGFPANGGGSIVRIS